MGAQHARADPVAGAIFSALVLRRDGTEVAEPIVLGEHPEEVGEQPRGPEPFGEARRHAPTSRAVERRVLREASQLRLVERGDQAAELPAERFEIAGLLAELEQRLGGPARDDAHCTLPLSTAPTNSLTNRCSSSPVKRSRSAPTTRLMIWSATSSRMACAARIASCSASSRPSVRMRSALFRAACISRSR